MCGAETYDCFPYYEASALVDSKQQIQNGFLETTTTTTNSYSQVTERSGYLCDTCIKKDKWTGLINSAKFLGVVLAIALVAFLIANENGATAIAGLAGVVGGLILLYFLLGTVVTLISSNGSAVLVNHLKRMMPHKSPLYFTPSEAAKMHRSR